MHVFFCDDLAPERPTIFHVELPIIPRVGDLIEVPGVPSSHPGWIVRLVSWDFQHDHDPYAVFVYIAPLG